jgi:uncharacterized membrane protein YphA (DoxX/SURF4 family)
MQFVDIVRLTTALFLLPHMLLKIPRLGTLHVFYERARLPYPRALALLGFAVEVIIIASLLSGVETRRGAQLGVAFLLCAALATVRTNGWGKWRWEKGGPEYPLYLAAILSIVAARS